MRYYTKHPVGTFIEVTEEAYEASLLESIGLSEHIGGQSRFKNCKGLLSLDRVSSGGEKATIKDMDGILKTVHYFFNEGISLLKEITAWSESSMLSRMKEEIENLEASLADTKNWLAEINKRNGEYIYEIDTLQREGAVKDFLLKVSSRKNWRNKSICKDEDNFLYLHNCVDKGDCEGCNRTFIGKVVDYL